MVRREFMAATGASAVAISGASKPGESFAANDGEKLTERTLVGYVDNLSVRPGETVEFKVSSFGGQYQADLV